METLRSLYLNGTIFAVLTTVNITKIASESFALDIPALDYASMIFQVEQSDPTLGPVTCEMCLC